MKKQLFITLLVMVSAMTSCKKTYDDPNNDALEIGEIKNHLISSAQAEKIAVLYLFILKIWLFH